MTTRPFLLLSTRDHELVAEDEYANILRFGGLRESMVRRVRMEQGPIGAVDPGEYAGVILGGGPFCGSTPYDQQSPLQRRVESELHPLLRRALQTDTPVLGICYGVGSLAKVAGAQVDDTYSEPISAPTLTVTEAGAADPIARELPSSFHAYVGHKEAVTQLPADAEVLVSGEACPVQMLRLRENAYVTQFHPEADHLTMAKRIDAYRDAGYFPPEEVDRLVEMTASYAEAIRPAHTVLAAFVDRFAY